MSTLHLPVLIWPDAAGTVTAALVGDFDEAAATAPTDKEALHQLKELLEWRQEHEAWNVDPDFQEPKLIEVKVDVLPQYRDGRRIIPCPETLPIRVPCVIGVQENGLPACSVPHLGIRFTFQDASALRSLVNHYVKEELQGLSPAQLFGCLPPKECRLEELVLRESSQSTKASGGGVEHLKTLMTVAAPMLQSSGRKRVISTAYGREALSAALGQKLGREKANVLLVGSSGVGKTTLLVDAAKRIAREQSGDDETTPTRNRFWRGSGGRIIAGMCYLGQWEERCEEFIEQLGSIGGIFCAENLLELVQVGGQEPGNSVAAFLLPYLQRGELRMVAEATPAELEACRRLLPGFLDLFQVVTVPAFSDSEALNVLNRIARAYTSDSRTEFEPGAITLVHRLFQRFLPYSTFPGQTAPFVRALCDRPQKTGNEAKQVITIQDVTSQFIKQTGLLEVFLRDELPMSFEAVLQTFDSQIIGQSAATEAAARLVMSIKSGLTDPNRPFGVFLFCGPTGVGKTALAKSLADFCFGAGGQKDRLVRLDMSEYGSWGAGARLLQSPNGNPAPWIEQIRRQPFSVVLFDEIEKAAPEVFDVLLRLLDEGILTDRFGRVTNFRSAIVILTSNLGAGTTSAAGFGGDAGPAYESEVARFFRPEFFNRLDEVIAFKPLSQGEVERIARKELGELGRREGFVSCGLQLEWSDRVVAAVAREGYDHRFGARPLQRALERLVVTPLAHWKVANPSVRDRVLGIDLDSNGKVTVGSGA